MSSVLDHHTVESSGEKRECAVPPKVFRVLLIVDKYGWAYHAIAQGLLKYNDRSHLALDVMSQADDMESIRQFHERYDLVFPLGWIILLSKKKKNRFQSLLPFLDPSKVITGIHSHRAWDDYASLPDFSPSPPDELIAKLSTFKGVNAISRRLHRLFASAGLPNLTLTENGVDTELFAPKVPLSAHRDRPLVIGFSGSAGIQKPDYLKGFSEYILPLKELPHVEVRTLGGRGEHQVRREDMPQLYNEIDLYACASTSEGFSQSVLEASACGRGILSTRVGGCEDLIEESINGFFIERDRKAIAKLVAYLEAHRDIVQRLGFNNRRIVLERYAWSVQIRQWLQFIESHLPVGPIASSSPHQEVAR